MGFPNYGAWSAGTTAGGQPAEEAWARGLAVATRNVTDFRGRDLVVANPWDFG
ncbi:MAG: type II toxin-antitoxin system VapC family toxin [Gemmatimonadetes bacterium]|nr:type II toxin-antitoxin system VapC family toxin [Gemmatimonadota bacterium]MYK67980.1 type II toxin-antitoxin system VapC family toxin [Gemmatimonadota bacterium]